MDVFTNIEIEDSHRDEKIGFIHVNSLSVEILKQSHVKASPLMNNNNRVVEIVIM